MKVLLPFRFAPNPPPSFTPRSIKFIQSPSIPSTKLSTSTSTLSKTKPPLTSDRQSKNMAPLTINSALRMNSGYEIPVLGYGVYQTPAQVTEEVVLQSFKAGYRHVDSAIAYRNEAPCGSAIQKSGIPRKDIFFTSKIPTRSLSYDNAKNHIANTLKETGLDYIDLMLIHAPYGGAEGRKGTWKALIEAHEEGKVRSLGISNYGVHHLDELETHIKELEEERGGKGKGGVISVGQWELHPWLPRPDIVKWCQKRGIVIEAYSPLVRGERLEEKLLQPLTKKYGKSPAQILMRWSLQKGFVPLPKSVTPSRIVENANVYDFELTAEEMKTLDLEDYAPCCWDPTKATLED